MKIHKSSLIFSKLSALALGFCRVGGGGGICADKLLVGLFLRREDAAAIFLDMLPFLN